MKKLVIALALLATACSGGEIADDTDSDTDISADTDTDTDSDTDTDTDSDTDTDPDGDIDLLDWFADYDTHMSLDYLDRSGTLHPEGDPALTDVAAHTWLEAQPYGPHARNVLDVWLPTDAPPTGVLVYFHAGGFIRGSRNDVRRTAALPRMLGAGIAVVAADYRYVWEDVDGALTGTPQDEGTSSTLDGARLDYTLRDCARAVQFLRYRADALGLGDVPIGAMGGSAGGGCTTWTGTVDDLADPDHPDPALHESSRLSVMVQTNSQPGYNITAWPEYYGFEESLIRGLLEHAEEGFYQLPEDKVWGPEGEALSQVLDVPAHMSADDPPLYSGTGNPDVPEDLIDNHSTLVHHPRGMVAMYEHCVEAGMDCSVQTEILREGWDRSPILFLIEHLGE